MPCPKSPPIAEPWFQKLVRKDYEFGLQLLLRDKSGAEVRLVRTMLLPSPHCRAKSWCRHMTESTVGGFLPLRQEFYNQRELYLSLDIARTGALPSEIEDIKSIRIAIRQIRTVSLSVVSGEGIESLCSPRLWLS